MERTVAPVPYEIRVERHLGRPVDGRRRGRPGQAAVGAAMDTRGGSVAGGSDEDEIRVGRLFIRIYIAEAQ